MNAQDDLDRWKWRLAHAVLQAIDLPSLRKKCLSNLDRWEANGVWCSAHDEWRELMAHGSDGDIIAAMTEEDQRANRLRQTPPYTGILNETTVLALRQDFLRNGNGNG